jgi:hypothetical protein
MRESRDQDSRRKFQAFQAIHRFAPPVSDDDNARWIIARRLKAYF